MHVSFYLRYLPMFSTISSLRNNEFALHMTSIERSMQSGWFFQGSTPYQGLPNLLSLRVCQVFPSRLSPVELPSRRP